MDIVSNREEMIFKNEYEGKITYKIGLYKKNKEGNLENGYMQVRFKQGVDLNNQTRILIKSAWLSFAKYENKTYPYIFINDFNIVDKGETELKTKTKSDPGEQLKITDEDLPF